MKFIPMIQRTQSTQSTSIRNSSNQYLEDQQLIINHCYNQIIINQLNFNIKRNRYNKRFLLQAVFKCKIAVIHKLGLNPTRIEK